jgi:hypothetical protein
MVSPSPNRGNVDPVIDGAGSRDSCHSDGTTKGSREVCTQGVSQGNPESEEILFDISISEYDNVCVAFKKRTLLGYFVGRVPPEFVIRVWECHGWC